MANFDYLSEIKDLQQLYCYCRDAENFQLVAPDKSVMGARKALEHWTKIVYLTQGWDIPQGAKLMELLSNQDFEDYIGDPQTLENIHFIRKIGNLAAHGHSIKKNESLQSLACLYQIIGEWLMVVGVVDEFPHFDPTLVPKVLTISILTTDGEPVLTPGQLETYAKHSEGKKMHVAPPQVLSEEETRRIYIDLMLREAGWEVLERKGAIVAGKACIEIELGNAACSMQNAACAMPNESGVGYADYVLYSDSLKPLAVIEAKRTSRDARMGKHQAELYADLLERQYGVRPVIYYSNGFVTHVQDGLGYPDRQVFSFHTKDELEKTIQKRGRKDITETRIREDIAGRYYQVQAVHAICEHLNRKHRRGLLVMATGTGKTRVSIALSEIIMRNNWAKNILFLADRRSLVKQAHKNFTKLLPNVTTTKLSEERQPDMNARIMFSTYQTMIRYIDEDEKQFSIGRFDLIIIDEAHRSVFGKYGTIFDYFDSLLIGLTATPREDIDRSTYALLQLEEGIPNFAYELEQAVSDGYLVNYSAYQRSSKIMTEGAKYDQLSDREKEDLEKVWDYEKAHQTLDPRSKYTRDIEGSEIFHYLFNIDTIDKVLQDLMDSGLKIEGGDKLGKSIIFAFNHKHAQQIVDRFHFLYPEKGEDYCVLIDNQVNYGQDLIDIFSTPKEEAPAKQIQIVVSVDMMDTGIDVPDCLNLVFFKPVRSKIKFNQMIGRGTRLCPNIFGEGKDKKEFLIFDYCGNFEFFNKHPRGAEPLRVPSISERIFTTRLDIAVLLQDSKYQEEEQTKTLCEGLKDILHAQVSLLNENQIAVRKEWERVVQFKKRENWQYLSEVDAQSLRKRIAPLIFTDDTDYAAKQFDLLCLLEELSLIDESVNGNKPMMKIQTIGELLEKKAAIPEVALRMNTIREIQSVAFWEQVHVNVLLGLDNLERVREELRDIIQYITGMHSETFEIDLEDVITDEGIVSQPVIQASYRQRVMDYLEDNLSHPVLQKIRTVEQITESDIRELEHIFWQELGTKEEYEAFLQQDRYRICGGKIAVFLRSVIGLDRDVARAKYIDMIQGGQLTQDQEEYLNDILNYVCENGDISRQTMGEEPFSMVEWRTIFNDRLTPLVNYVDKLHKVIGAL